MELNVIIYQRVMVTKVVSVNPDIRLHPRALSRSPVAWSPVPSGDWRQVTGAVEATAASSRCLRCPPQLDRARASSDEGEDHELPHRAGQTRVSRCRARISLVIVPARGGSAVTSQCVASPVPDQGQAIEVAARMAMSMGPLIDLGIHTNRPGISNKNFTAQGG